MLSMFEELPSGFHKVQGLGYLLRRADGYNHPRYVDAAAVAWPTAHESSYIEFMEKAFGEWKTTESTTFVSPYAHGHNPSPNGVAPHSAGGPMTHAPLAGTKTWRRPSGST